MEKRFLLCVVATLSFTWPRGTAESNNSSPHQHTHQEMKWGKEWGNNKDTKIVRIEDGGVSP